MWNTLTYLWETICLPWKAWLALLSFLLGLWFAWLLWGHWTKRLRKGAVRERDLSLEVAALRRQVREAPAELKPAAPLPVLPEANKVTKQKGDSGLEAASLLKELPEDVAEPDEGPFGKVYRFPPEHRDDLTSLRGIDDGVQKRLNGLGIYQFAQICELSDRNIRALQSEDPSLKEVHWSFWRDRLRARQSRLVDAAKSSGADCSVANPVPAEEQPVIEARPVAETKPLERKALVSEKPPWASNPLEKEELVFEEELVLEEKPLAPKPRKMAPLEPEWPGSVSAPVPAKEKLTLPIKPKAILAPVLPEHFAGEDMTLSSKFGWVYNRRPDNADDFSKLAGLKAGGGELLGKLGIHKFKQIAYLKDDELQALQDHDPKLEGPEWPQWRTHFKASDALPEIPEGLGDQAIEVSPTLGLLFREAPEETDDLSQLHGLYPSLAKSLNRSGIYRYAQLAQMSDAQIAAWEKQDPALEKLPWRTWRKRFQSSEDLTPPAILKGESVKWSPQFGWVFASRPKKADHLTLVEGVGPEQVADLHRLGVYRFAQISEWTDDEAAAFEKAAPSLKEVDWSYWRRELKNSGGDLDLPKGFKGEQVTLSPKLGFVYTAEPTTKDDLALLHGTDATTVQSWNEAGLFRYQQIGRLTDAQIEDWKKQTTSAPDFDWKGWRDLWASSDAEIEVPAEFDGDPVQVSPTLGVVYATAPQDADDFTRLQGVSTSAAEQLNRSGLYRYRQMAHFTDHQIDRWQKAAPAAKDVDWKGWREYLQSPDVKIEVPAEFEDEPVQVSPKVGIVYPYPPREVDDFAQLHGVSSQAAESLNRLGVYRYRQIACLSDAELNQLSAQEPNLKAVDWKAWRECFQTHGVAIEIPDALQGEPVGLSPQFGFLYHEAPGNADDFCRLKGVDAASAEAMNAMGLYRYEQLAQLSDAQIEAWRKADPGFDKVDWEHWRTYFCSGQVLATPEAFVGESIQHCPHLGVVYGQAPDKVDQLTLLHGVREEEADLLHDLGVYRFKQIAHWDQATIATLVSRCPELANIRWAEWCRRFADDGLALSVPKAFASDVVQLSPRFGVVYPEAPKEPDRLSLMEGVTAQTEKQLHELGFYRFKQIANLTDSQIDALRAESPEFKIVGWNLWRALLHIHGEPMATALARLRQGVPLEFADEAQVYQDTELGTLYRYKPGQVDSLSKIEGIDEEMERLLNGYGIWTFRQLAFLRAPQFAALRARNERLGGLRDTLHRWRSGSRCSVGSHWRWRSWELNEEDCPATDIEVDEAAPARLHQGDRLSLLPGVSGVGAVLLKDMGICQFEQIVQLTDEQIASFGMKYPCFKQLDPAKLRFAASRYLGQLVPRNGMPTDV